MESISGIILALVLLSTITIAILIVWFIHSEVDTFNKHKRAKEEWIKVQQEREHFYETQRKILRDVQREALRDVQRDMKQSLKTKR